jgi:hypothetical protein
MSSVTLLYVFRVHGYINTIIVMLWECELKEDRSQVVTPLTHIQEASSLNLAQGHFSGIVPQLSYDQ